MKQVSTQIEVLDGDVGSDFRIATAPQFWLKEFGRCTLPGLDLQHKLLEFVPFL